MGIPELLDSIFILKPLCILSISLRWRHNGSDSVSNHQPYDCLLNYLYRRRSKKTSKLRVTGLCVGNSPGTGEFPAQMASYAENISIWWRHHDTVLFHYDTVNIFCGTHEGEIWDIFCHDDVIKWKHFSCYWPFVRAIHQSPVDSPHNGQWCIALMFCLICAWINNWTNNWEGGDFRCHRTQYDLTVMRF